MGTVTREMAEEIAAANGHYFDDPRVYRIVEYTNASGGTAYGLEYRQDIGRYQASEYVINPRVFWEAK